MGKWLYYNFAAGSFNTKKHCSRLYLIEIELIQFNIQFIYGYRGTCACIRFSPLSCLVLIQNKKKTKIAFEPPFGGFRYNVRTLSIARWKARNRLSVLVIIELFRFSNG